MAPSGYGMQVVDDDDDDDGEARTNGNSRCWSGLWGSQMV